MQEILLAFREKAEEFAKKHGLDILEFPLEYKNSDNGIEFRYPFKRFALSFVWMYRGDFSLDYGLQNMLSCRLYFDDEFPIYCWLYDIMDLLDENDFKCSFFPYIENERRFLNCFNALSATVSKYLPRIIEIANDEQQRSSVIFRMRREICELTQDDELFDLKYPSDDDGDDAKLLYGFEEHYRERCIKRYYAENQMRFSGEAYNAFLRGNYAKALKKFSSFKNYTYYQKRLIEFIQKNFHDGTVYNAITDEANSLNYSLWSKYDKTHSAIIIANCFLAVPFLSLAYMVEYYVVAFIVAGQRAILYTPMLLHNAKPPCLIAGAVGALLLCYGLRRRLYRWYFRGSAQKHLEYDRMMNDHIRVSLMKKLALVVYVWSLSYVALSACGGYLFCGSGFYDNSDLFSINSRYYSYNDVENIYVTEKKALCGSKLNYCFKLKDGTVIEMEDALKPEDISTVLKERWEHCGVEFTDDF